jgi:hypothetical protein
MAIDDEDVVDIISDNKEGTETYLTLLDPYDWEDDEDTPKHLLLIQEKVNSYIAFYESKEIYKKHPSAKGKKIVISIMCQYEPSAMAKEFFRRAEEFIISAGLGFRIIVVPD